MDRENCRNREELMNQIMAYKFAINDMSLFLNTHPDDERALKYHNEYVCEFNRIKEEYNLKGEIKVVSHLARQYIIPSDKQSLAEIGEKETQR